MVVSEYGINIQVHNILLNCTFIQNYQNRVEIIEFRQQFIGLTEKNFSGFLHSLSSFLRFARQNSCVLAGYCSTCVTPKIVINLGFP